jgi:IclR family acetate operon transcriptional repressor
LTKTPLLRQKLPLLVMTIRGADVEIRSVSKAVRLIQALGEDGGAQGVSDLARRLEMDKASVSRILRTLEQGGLVAQDQTTRGYTLGLTLVHLGQKALRRIDLRTAAQDGLDTLAAEIGECSQLAIFAGDKALYIAQARPPRGVNIDAPIGTLVPLHCTALGKVLLAFQREPLRKEILARIALESFTRRTIRDVDVLEAHLDKVRKEGVAFDDEEFSVGVRCIAGPVFKHDGLLAGAIGISGPSPRVTDDRISLCEDIVRREALALSRKVGLER